MINDSPLSVRDLVTRLSTRVPDALDRTILELPEDAPNHLFGGDWSSDIEDLNDNLLPLPRRREDLDFRESNDDRPRDRGSNGLPDSIPILNPDSVGDWVRGESGLVWQVPEVKELPGMTDAGTDLLAWYTPFHVDPRRWGIYIREMGLHYLAQRVFEPEGLSYVTALNMALRLLYDHEAFHFLTEMAAASWELTSKRPQYIPYAASHRAGNRIFNPLEEALAEANSFWRYRVHQCKLHYLNDAVSDYLLGGPPGYRDFGQYTTYATRGLGLQELAGQISNGVKGQPESFGELAFDYDNRIVNREQVPVRLVRMRGWHGPWATFAKFTPALQVDESSGFKKELRKSGSAIQKKWKEKRKQLLTEAINSPGLYFKAIPRCPGRFFLRVEDNYRAILEPLPGGNLIATRIMDHQEYNRVLKHGCE